jgi:hypothetical protein
MSSGDSNGNVWVWDWKTCKVLKKFKAHETSKMATCSWDGVSFDSAVRILRILIDSFSFYSSFITGISLDFIYNQVMVSVI